MINPSGKSGGIFIYENLALLSFFLYKTVYIAVEFLLVVFVFAKFFVDKRSDKDYIRKNIKP
jgi:hypothetical protein